MVAALCGSFYYGLVVKTLPPVTVQSTGCTFRVNSYSHNLQLYSGEQLDSFIYLITLTALSFSHISESMLDQK